MFILLCLRTRKWEIFRTMKIKGRKHFGSTQQPWPGSSWPMLSTSRYNVPRSCHLPELSGPVHPALQWLCVWGWGGVGRSREWGSCFRVINHIIWLLHITEKETEPQSGGMYGGSANASKLEWWYQPHRIAGRSHGDKALAWPFCLSTDQAHEKAINYLIIISCLSPPPPPTPGVSVGSTRACLFICCFKYTVGI